MVERADPGERLLQRVGVGRIHDDGLGTGD